MGKLLNAIVKYPVNKIIKTQYGERINIVCTCGDDEFTIWGEPDTQKGEQLKAYKKGDMVLVVEDNGKHKLLENDTQNTSTNGNNNGSTTKSIKPNYEPLTDDKKREIATYIKDMTGLYGFCLEQAKGLNKDGLNLPPEAIKDVATTLFITSQRHFNL